MTTRVEDVMRRHVYRISSDASVGNAARALIVHGIESLIVVDDDRVVGIVTERDLLAAILPPMAEVMTSDNRLALTDAIAQAAERADQRVAAIMTHPVAVTYPHVALLRAVGTMLSRRHRRLPVVERHSQRLVGLITQRDALAVVFMGVPMTPPTDRCAVPDDAPIVPG